MNPIHAGIASTQEGSGFTSAQKIQPRGLEATRAELQRTIDTACWLCPVERIPLDRPSQGMKSFLNIELEEYFELLDWTGRQHRLDKKGTILDEMEAILKRLEIDIDSWLMTVKSSDSWFY